MSCPFTCFWKKKASIHHFLELKRPSSRFKIKKTSPVALIQQALPEDDLDEEPSQTTLKACELIASFSLCSELSTKTDQALLYFALGLKTGVNQVIVGFRGVACLAWFCNQIVFFSSHSLAIRDTLWLLSCCFAGMFSRGPMWFGSAKLNLEVFCTQRDAKVLLAPVQVLLHRRLKLLCRGAKDLQKTIVVVLQCASYSFLFRLSPHPAKRTSSGKWSRCTLVASGILNGKLTRHTILEF